MHIATITSFISILAYHWPVCLFNADMGVISGHSRTVFSFLFGYIFFRRRNVLSTILHFDKNYNFSIAQFKKKNDLFLLQNQKFLFEFRTNYRLS